MDLFYYHAILGLMLICWCSMHSALISLTFTSLVERWASSTLRYYRIVYNGFSVVTLFFIVSYIFWLQTLERAVLQWTGNFIALRFLLIGIAIFFFIVGAKRYDMSYFLGISQVKAATRSVILGATPDFQTHGIFGLTRHPWYFGGIVALWSVPAVFYPSTIMTACIFSCYFVVGAVLEERKLLVHFGDSYRVYQQKVPMFFSINKYRH